MSKDKKLDIVISSPAIEIALMQLEMLRQKASTGLLTLEETKQYDLLCKNLNLMNGDPTSIEAGYKKLRDIDEQKLIAIVSKSEVKKIPKDPDD